MNITKGVSRLISDFCFIQHSVQNFQVPGDRMSPCAECLLAPGNSAHYVEYKAESEIKRETPLVVAPKAATITTVSTPLKLLSVTQ